MLYVYCIVVYQPKEYECAEIKTGIFHRVRIYFFICIAIYSDYTSYTAPGEASPSL